jgi:hypothetical protein
VFFSNQPERLAAFYATKLGLPLEHGSHGPMVDHIEGGLGDVHIAVLKGRGPDPERGGRVAPTFRVRELDAFVAEGARMLPGAAALLGIDVEADDTILSRRASTVLTDAARNVACCAVDDAREDTNVQERVVARVDLDRAHQRCLRYRGSASTCVSADE